MVASATNNVCGSWVRPSSVVDFIKYYRTPCCRRPRCRRPAAAPLGAPPVFFCTAAHHLKRANLLGAPRPCIKYRLPSNRMALIASDRGAGAGGQGAGGDAGDSEPAKGPAPGRPHPRPGDRAAAQREAWPGSSGSIEPGGSAAFRSHSNSNMLIHPARRPSSSAARRRGPSTSAGTAAGCTTPRSTRARE